MTDEQKVTRKLKAILSADVKGYSILMADDEVHTVKKLNEYRDSMADIIKSHSGRVVDAVGDNLLAEFSSAVDAVQCSVEIQRDLKQKNEELSEEKRLEFRIGINIGDVIHEEDRIYGSGVNVAARIEGLAEPGGVCISRNAYNHSKDKLKLGYEYFGEHTVKNIKDPVRVYKILMGPEDAGKLIGEEQKSPLKTLAWSAIIVASIIFIALAREDFYTPLGLLSAYIVPAAKSSTPLPENPEKANKIKSYSNLLQTTNSFKRRKMNKKTRETSRGLKFETYVNNEYGFSIKYDADLLDMYEQPVSPIIFRRRGLKGLPVFAALVDDIPQGMALENTADYMINLYKNTLKITDYKIKKQNRTRLLDGTQANYFELTWKYQALELLTVGIFTYKNNKIIGAVAGSTQETPIDYLAGMVKSLKFKK